MNKKILINAANLHVGGGVQVAVSFIYEMTQLLDYDFSNINVIASSPINKALIQLNVDTSIFQSYRVIDLYGIQAFFSSFNQEIKKYDVVFTIFGPNYLRNQAKKEIVGFAQSWILEFDNALTQKMKKLSKLKQRIKRFIQWLIFKRSDLFIVELEHVKNKLIDRKKINSSNIHIVNNTASSLYFDQSQWRNIVIKKSTADLHLGIVSRDYSHKNLSILPFLGELLLNKYNFRVHFYVTFNNLEWTARNNNFKKYVTNVGVLQPNECPSFYQQIDGVIFPSLLECFSATPLEALVMEKPLFASDRDFVRDVCGDYAIYFDPLNIDSIAKSITNYFTSDEDHFNYLSKAKNHATNFSNAKDRALKYLQIITHS